MAVSSSRVDDVSRRQGNTPPPFYVRTNRISCDPCRKRKLRCNRVKPCSTCTKRHIEDQCYQDDRELAAESATSASSSFGKRPRLNGFSSLDVPRREQTDEEEEAPTLSASLIKCKEQLEALTSLARLSSQSLESAIDKLPSVGQGGDLHVSAVHRLETGSGRGGLITWADVKSQLPSVEECEDLITFYFEELSSYVRISQRTLFEKHWRMLLDGTGIGRTEAAIIFTAFALADIMIPSSSPLSRHSKQAHQRWLMILGDPFSLSPTSAPIDNSFPRIQLLGLRSIYHLYEGRSDRLWECVGITMRRAIVSGLFDERSKSWLGLDNLQKEYRRRFAWYMLSLERWVAVVRQLPFALHPSYVYLAEASFEPDSRVMRLNRPAPIVPVTPLVLSDGRLQHRISARKPGAVKFVHIELLAWCQEYLDQFASMDLPARYSRAAMLDDVLERVLQDGLANTGIERHELRFLSSAILDECVKERQVEVTLWVSSVFFLRCLITRRFLMDENAPPNLRFVSLIYAQGILSTIPSLTRLVKEGQHPVQTTWNANHLLAAATTFTVVILGQDVYVESQAHPLEAETVPNKGKAKGVFPTEQMDWLADNIFVTLDCLDTLIRRGNHTAETAKQLLERLCGTQSELRKLYRQRLERVAQTELEQQQLQQQQDLLRRQRQGNVDPSRVNNATSESDRANFSSTALQSTPSPASVKTTSPRTSISDIGLRDADIMPLLQPPMNASSLLDAVLMDPTELDFLGSSNHSELLAHLLQDSPPV